MARIRSQEYPHMKAVHTFKGARGKASLTSIYTKKMRSRKCSNWPRGWQNRGGKQWFVERGENLLIFTYQLFTDVKKEEKEPRQQFPELNHPAEYITPENYLDSMPTRQSNKSRRVSHLIAERGDSHHLLTIYHIYYILYNI